jgi:hypothetical protein
MSGVLDIAVMMNPFGEWDESKGDHHTDLGIKPKEWEELFFKVLQAPPHQKYIDGEDIYEYDKRQERLFKKDLKDKGYEMLGRIWDIYQDAEYLPSEVNQLLEECLEAQKRTNNEYALSALEKLISACREALKIGSGLCLLSD